MLFWISTDLLVQKENLEVGVHTPYTTGQGLVICSVVQVKKSQRFAKSATNAAILWETLQPQVVSISHKVAYIPVSTKARAYTLL